MAKIQLRELEQIDLPTYQNRKEIKVKYNTDKRKEFYGKKGKHYAQ